MSKRKTNSRFVVAALILILVLVMIYSGLRILESTVFYSQPEEKPAATKTITRDGIDYFPRQDITVLLVMGIDEEGIVKDSGSYRNNGEADMVALLILDQSDETYTVLPLNRDMMLQMPALGIGGKEAGTFYGQLALSHTYGSGLADSAENTRKTVSNLFYGITIDHYVAMNMDAIGILNDAVGGVKVTVVDDFSKVDSTLTKGEVVLNREQALNFVRTRKDVGNQLNLSRMERHKEYLLGLTAALSENLHGSDSFTVELYEEMSPYMVTDCSVNAISGLLQRCADYSMKGIVSIAGENKLGEEYYEFYADAEKLDTLILQLFYAPKN